MLANVSKRAHALEVLYRESLPAGRNVVRNESEAISARPGLSDTRRKKEFIMRDKVLCVLLSPLSSSLSERALQSACCPCLHRPVTATVDRAASCSFSLSPTALCPRILRPSIATTRPFQRSFFRNQKVSSPVVLYLFSFCFSSLDISRPLAIDTHYYIPPHSKCTRNISHTFDPAIIICVDHRSSGLLGEWCEVFWCGRRVHMQRSGRRTAPDHIRSGLQHSSPKERAEKGHCSDGELHFILE